LIFHRYVIYADWPPGPADGIVIRMKRAIAVSVAIASAVFATAGGLLSYAAKPLPDFSGTWRLATLELKPMVHRYGHVHSQVASRALPMAMNVAQARESVTVQIQVLDAAGRVVSSPGRFAYRAHWSASGTPPLDSAVRTRMKAHRRDGTLELTTVMAASGRAADADVYTTTTETWRIGADGLLERRIHGVHGEETLDRVETWRRIVPR
jgi:hypothetical protein